MPDNLKQPTTYDEQIEKLQQRGCMIEDVPFCKKALASINYYRLTAYFLPFKNADGSYHTGITFHRVYRIYEFDRKLRELLFAAIEEIEISLRVRFAYYHAHQYGAEGYLDDSNFKSRHDAEKFTRHLNQEIKNNEKVLFVKHHLENYNGHFPIWVATELFTFGMLSYFYADMKTRDQKYLASELYGTTPKNLVSWLRCCTDLRNICAHYGRLYYRIFPAIPAGIDVPAAAQRRLWGTVLMLRNLYPDMGKWNDSIIPRMQALFEEYQNDIDLYHIAFPKDWDKKIQKTV